MNAKDLILENLNMSEGIAGGYLDGLSDADLLVRPVPGMNHIAWQLGHLLVSETGMLDGVKPGSSVTLPDGFAEAHGRDEASLSSNDPSRFASKETYVSLRKAQREAARKVLAGMTDAELEAPAPERLRRMCPTAGSVLMLIGGHEMMHAGQFVAVRRLLGKPVTM